MVIAAVVSMMSDVPTQADRIPARSALRDGNWPRKSRLGRGAPLFTRSMNSTASTSSAANMTSRPTTTNNWSRTLRLSTSARIWRSDSAAVAACISVRLAEAPGEREAGNVEHERHQHEHEAGGEDRLVANTLMRQVPETHLDDEGRDRRRGLGGVPRQVWLQARRDGDDHRLADRARDAEDIGGRDAGQRAGNDHAGRGLETR